MLSWAVRPCQAAGCRGGSRTHNDDLMRVGGVPSPPCTKEPWAGVEPATVRLQNGRTTSCATKANRRRQDFYLYLWLGLATVHPLTPRPKTHGGRNRTCNWRLKPRISTDSPVFPVKLHPLKLRLTGSIPNTLGFPSSVGIWFAACVVGIFQNSPRTAKNTIPRLFGTLLTAHTIG